MVERDVRSPVEWMWRAWIEGKHVAASRRHGLREGIKFGDAKCIHRARAARNSSSDRRPAKREFGHLSRLRTMRYGILAAIPPQCIGIRSQHWCLGNGVVARAVLARTGNFFRSKPTIMQLVNHIPRNV